MLSPQLLEPLLGAGGGDAAHDFARPLPPQVLLTFLNQPSEDWRQIKQWCEDAYLQAAPQQDQQARFLTADQRLWTYSSAVVSDRKRQPRDPAIDPVTGLLAARAEGEPLDESLIAGVVRLLIAAGHDSTTSAVGIALHYLARNPEEQQRLRDNPSLIPGAIEEILRLETQVLAMPRIVAQDTIIRDRELKQGDRVMLYWASARQSQPRSPVDLVQSYHPKLWRRCRLGAAR